MQSYACGDSIFAFANEPNFGAWCGPSPAQAESTVMRYPTAGPIVMQGSGEVPLPGSYSDTPANPANQILAPGLTTAQGATTDAFGNLTTGTGSWFTDPASEIIGGIPNWALLAAAAAAFLLLRK